MIGMCGILLNNYNIIMVINVYLMILFVNNNYTYFCAINNTCLDYGKSYSWKKTNKSSFVMSVQSSVQSSQGTLN